MLKANHSLSILQKLDQAPQSKVCLVQATKIPGRTSTFLKAKIDGKLPSADVMVFEPAFKDLETNGLSSPEALLTPDSEGSLLIPMQNFRHSPIELDQGVELGIVEQVDPQLLSTSEPNLDSPSMCAKVMTRSQPERWDKLMPLLDLPQHCLSPDQLQQLTVVLKDASDVFSLDESELGCTDTVQHTIDTGSPTHPSATLPCPLQSSRSNII